MPEMMFSNIYKLCKKFPKLMKSSIGLGFLKNYYKDIKDICNKNEQEFSKSFYLVLAPVKPRRE